MSDQAAQRIADRQEQLRADRLLRDGLSRLREGRAPTATQLPLVQQWLLSQDNQIQALKEAADRERIDKESTERIYSHLVSKWNAVTGATPAASALPQPKPSRSQWKPL